MSHRRLHVLLERLLYVPRAVLSFSREQSLLSYVLKELRIPVCIKLFFTVSWHPSLLTHSHGVLHGLLCKELEQDRIFPGCQCPTKPVCRPGLWRPELPLPEGPLWDWVFWNSSASWLCPVENSLQHNPLLPRALIHSDFFPSSGPLLGRLLGVSSQVSLLQESCSNFTTWGRPPLVIFYLTTCSPLFVPPPATVTACKLLVYAQSLMYRPHTL